MPDKRCVPKVSCLPVISVITVVYNAENCLKETIISVLSQTYPEIEYIIIDGNSTDGTRKIIEEYKESLGNYISEKDEGIYDAMNKGARLAKGQWLLFMNAGDLLKIDLWKVQEMISSLAEADTLAILGAANVCDENGEFIYEYKASLTRDSDFFFKMPACHQSIIYNTLYFEEYDTKYKVIADKDSLYKIYKNNLQKTFLITEEVISSYNLGGYSSRMEKRYHYEEACFFSKVNNLGGKVRVLVYFLLRVKGYIHKVNVSLGLWRWLKKRKSNSIHSIGSS